MRAVVRNIRDAWLDWRTMRWLVRLRFELWRNGGRLKVARWRGVKMAAKPRIRTLPLGSGSGLTTLRLDPGVMIGHGTIVEIFAQGDNVLHLRESSRIYEGARLELRGGVIDVGERCMVHDHAVLKSNGDLILGEDVRVSYGSCIHCSDHIELGRYTGLAEYVTIVDSDHTPDGSDIPLDTHPIVTDPVFIEPNVFLARGALVLRGSRIGRNSVVAANSVVRRGEYPARCLLAGNPAEHVKQLTPRS